MSRRKNETRDNVAQGGKKVDLRITAE